MNFEEILNKPVEEIEKPRPLPVGTYQAIVADPPEPQEIGQKKTPAVVVHLKILAPEADVDHEELSQMGGIKENKVIRHVLFLTEESQFYTKNFFLEHLGVGNPGMTFAQLIAEAQGAQCLVKLRQKPSRDGTTLYNEVESTTAI